MAREVQPPPLSSCSLETTTLQKVIHAMHLLTEAVQITVTAHEAQITLPFLWQVLSRSLMTGLDARWIPHVLIWEELIYFGSRGACPSTKSIACLEIIATTFSIPTAHLSCARPLSAEFSQTKDKTTAPFLLSQLPFSGRSIVRNQFGNCQKRTTRTWWTAEYRTRSRW